MCWSSEAGSSEGGRSETGTDAVPFSYECLRSFMTTEPVFRDRFAPCLGWASAPVCWPIYVGFRASASSSAGGPDEIRFVPRNATLVAYANVQEVMTSSLRNKLRDTLPIRPEGQRQLQNETGINVETDIDRVVACIAPPLDGASHPPATGLVLARGSSIR